MKPLEGEDAFSALRASLGESRDASSFICQDVPYERLRLALIDTNLSSVDRAVRLRHALRYALLSDPFRSDVRSLPLPDSRDWPTLSACANFGLRTRPGRTVDALPWTPNWLNEIPVDGVDATSAAAAPRPWNNSIVAIDPWVERNLEFGSYRGPGQALAVRSALHISPGQTLLVLLPTGEGKSLVFQVLAAAHPAKTVAVVVPTIALAHDHAASASEFVNLRPNQLHAYVGNDEVAKEEIRQSIISGSQGLVYAAPEAMVASLRYPLLEAARNGRLAALVIDEAHLVDAWGTDFRSEFQMLAALVAELRNVAPPNKQPAVVCLSATVTQEAKETLESLFSPNGPIAIVPAARLRPEPDIWLSPVCDSPDERAERVLEALRYLPRPAILYVTKPDEADWWLRRLRDAGFRRVSAVHGKTSGADRAKIVEAWRTGVLDLVVGNSAFGLGIDFSHVRAVIHACIPESLDRYYQEVGRSGRDNHASIALLVPCKDDFFVAKSLSTKRIISVDKGIRRWEGMFRRAERSDVSTAYYALDLSSCPDYDRDMNSDQHEDWNGRVLALMARAKIIRMVGLQPDRQKPNRTRTVVELLDDGHSDRALWDVRVKVLRRNLFTAYRAAYFHMCEVIKNNCCPATILAQLYQIRHCGMDYPVVMACGGCASCRRERTEGWYARWPSAPASPWPVGLLNDHVRSGLDNGRSLVERADDSWSSRRDQRRLTELVHGLWNAGFRKCLIVGNAPDALVSALAIRPWCVARGNDAKLLGSNGLPDGPEIVWVGIGSALKSHHLGTLPAGQERIIMLPPHPADPLNPGRSLADRLLLMPFDKFYNYMLP